MLTRFAPSPTGYIHLGNVRTALVCWLYARKSGGKFMLRLDDTDIERSKEIFVEGIKRDLTWLGLGWDLEMRQSERLARYREVVEVLIKDGRVYACFETEQELDVKRKMQMSRGLPPIYDRAALKLTEEQKQKFLAEGRKPHYRFLMKDESITWNDEVRGPVAFEGKHLSDPIIVREGGSFTYMLPSAVDDADYAITHVVRGEDHVTNTAVQIQMFKAMGKVPPTFAHTAFVKTKEGKLSKREGSEGMQEFREAGIEPLAIASFLAKVGTSDPIEVRASLEELVAEFDMKKFSRSPTIYAPEDIDRLNAKLIHLYTFAKVAPRLKEMGLSAIDESFWNAVRPNLKTVNEVKDWWTICRETLSPEIEDADFAKAAAEILPTGKWDEKTWDIWVNDVKQKTGRSGKTLFMPLRKALTAMEHGPELRNLLPLIGRDKAIARLHGKAA
ncbi:MAG: glutamate--tRNA ligase [Proteobacteria bacterium]|nr:glutamate--tRNA ligase [Pseudomonadota bacterium]